jgi:hypothetical protein
MRRRSSLWRVTLFWAVVAVVVALLALDWRVSTPHDRFAEPLPLALLDGPANDAGHCALAPGTSSSR